MSSEIGRHNAFNCIYGILVQCQYWRFSSLLYFDGQVRWLPASSWLTTASLASLLLIFRGISRSPFLLFPPRLHIYRSCELPKGLLSSNCNTISATNRRHSFKPDQSPEMSFGNECEWNKMPGQSRACWHGTGWRGGMPKLKISSPLRHYLDILAWTLLLHKHALCNTCLFVLLSLCTSSQRNFQPRHNLFAVTFP